jgi:quercetin dioxygenase-like cupin family protein
MYKTSKAAVSAQGGDGRQAWWLLHGEAGPTTAGAFGTGQLEPGVETPMHRHPYAEEAILVLEGEGVAMTSAGEQPLRPGMILFAPRGSWHGVRAGESQVRQLMIYGGVSAAADAGRETPSGELRDERLAAAVLDMEQAIDHPFHDPDQGFRHLSARWLVDGEERGSEQLVLGQSTFEAARGAHELHRHPHAAEFLYLLEGDGVHVTEDGHELPIAPGDVTLVPAGEWHGFRNHGSATARAIFGYFGVNSLEAAGYELPDAQTLSSS